MKKRLDFTIEGYNFDIVGLPLEIRKELGRDPSFQAAVARYLEALRRAKETPEWKAYQARERAKFERDGVAWEGRVHRVGSGQNGAA